MGAIHPDYLCHCQVPRMQVHGGEETGLCDICNGVYDERLYEMRLRQHVAGIEGETLSEILANLDPTYRALVSG